MGQRPGSLRGVLGVRPPVAEELGAGAVVAVGAGVAGAGVVAVAGAAAVEVPAGRVGGDRKSVV